MDSALGWIGQIIEWFGQFIPRFVLIDLTQCGVKMRLGREVTVLEPGLHIYWPLPTALRTCP